MEHPERYKNTKKCLTFFMRKSTYYDPTYHPEWQIKYKTLLRYVRKYNPEKYNRYNQIKFSQKDERYQLGYRNLEMDTMLDIVWDYKKRLLITEQSERSLFGYLQ